MMHTEALRELCLSFKGATEEVKWENDLCFCVGEKMFVTTALEGPFRASFKVSPEDFDEYVARPGIRPAPYLGRYHWVQVESPQALTAEEWTRSASHSYALVVSKLPKKLRSQFHAD